MLCCFAMDMVMTNGAFSPALPKPMVAWTTSGMVVSRINAKGAKFSRVGTKFRKVNSNFAMDDTEFSKVDTKFRRVI